MSRRVLKWQVAGDVAERPIGTGRVVLVAMQGSILCVWTEEDGEPDPAPRRVACVFGTGHPVPPAYTEHIGSVVDGMFVWHVYGRWLP